MSFPLNPVDGARTIANGIKYVYSAATNSWRRDFNNVLDRLFLVGGNQATNTGTGDLVVYGGAGFGKNVYIGGNLFVAGTSTTFTQAIVGTISTASAAYNIIGGARGSLVYQTTASTTGFITIANTGSILMSNGVIPIWTASAAISVAQATSATNIVGGLQYQIPFQAGVNLTTFSANLTYNNATLSIKNATVSTDSNTGALVVGGGVGIGGDVYIAGGIQVNGTATWINSTNVNIVDKNIVIAQGSINNTAANGAGLTVDTPTNKPQIYYASTDDSWNLNKPLNLNSGIQSSSTVTGTLRVIGGVGIAGDLFAGSLRGPLTGTVGAGTKNSGAFTTLAATSTAVSTSTATGALTVAGGAGIAGDLYVGGLIIGNILSAQLATTATYASIATTALTANYATTASVASVASVANNIAGGATGRVPFQSGTSSTTFSANLTFDGTNLQTTKITVSQTDTSILPSFSTGLSLVNTGNNQSPVLRLAGNTNGFAFVASSGTLKIMQDAVSSLTNSLMNISLTGVSIPTQTVSTASTNGALTVAGGVGIAGNVYIGSLLDVKSTVNVASTLTANSLVVGSTSTFNGSLLPTLDTTYDLGSLTAKWKTLYVSSSTVYLGSNSISATANGITLNGKPLVSSSVQQYILSTSSVVTVANGLMILNNTDYWTSIRFLCTSKRVGITSPSGNRNEYIVSGNPSMGNDGSAIIPVSSGVDGVYSGNYILDLPINPPIGGPNAPGTPGQVAYDNTYTYVCVTTDTWHRWSSSRNWS